MDFSTLKKYLNPPKTIIYWIGFMLLGLSFFGLMRLAFLVRHRNLIAIVPFRDIFLAFPYGVRFDLVVLCYLVLPFFVISFIPYLGFESSKVIRRILQAILYTIFSLLIFLCLVDIEYYSAYGDRLGVWFYSYLDKPALVWYTIVSDYPVVFYMILWAILVAAFLYLAIKLNRIFKTSIGLYGYTPLLTRLTYFVVGLGFLAIGMRGSVTLAPLDWGSAKFSNSGFANDLSLNGIFTLGRSLYENYDDDRRSNAAENHFMTHDEALKIVQGQLVTPSDSLLDPEHSLMRLSRFSGNDTTKYNVVIIVMESWSALFVGALGGKPDATPFFDSLAQKSILFDNFYASGLRTNRGLLSVLCSFPSLPGRTVMKRYGAPHPFSSIADILGERGYDSYFIYGGDLGFDNMQGFFRDEGFKNFIGIDDFPSNTDLNKWGVPDHLVFEKANDTFSKLRDKPFVCVIVTLSNHEPFMLPGPEFDVFPQGIEFRDYLNTFHYSDWSLGHFFALAEKEPYFKNTIFVLVGDHGKILYNADDMRGNFRIASLIYCPGRSDIKPQIVEKVCGQVDLLPTILGLLNRPAIHESWGRDIFAPGSDTSGFTFLNKDKSFAWVEGQLMLYEKTRSLVTLNNINSKSGNNTDSSSQSSERLAAMQRKGRAMQQLEVEMVHEGPISNK
jgi:phosphoglycerol transferase MdoB-like AlkP superfamily enzyme